MLNTYNSSSQTVSTGENIAFAANRILTGCAMSHAVGGDTIVLNKVGYYQITFDGTGAATEAQTSPIKVQLYNGATAIPGGTASALSTATTDIANFSFSTIVPVRCSCPAVDNTVNLTVQNTGVDATFSNANLTVVRLA